MLTAAQIEKRRGRLTASRVSALMTGDAAGVLRLYYEMIGELPPEDLSHVWPVRLGEATEELNLEWYAMKSGGSISRMGEVVLHQTYPWAAATLDAWDDALGCPIECKHVGGREPLEVIIDRYQPQMQWQMECTGASQCVLSVIMGANEPVVEYIERDAVYAAELIKRGMQFMGFVRRKQPPVVLDAVPPPADASKIYDMNTSNQWCSEAVSWLENKEASERYKEAEKLLKSLVPIDAKKCFGAGVRITRDRASRLSCREDQ